MTATYTLTDHGITCHLCGFSSANPNDMRERYCGHCHVFHEDLDIVLRELSALEPMGPIGYRPETVLQLVGLIQLALRHPAVTQAIRATGVRFIEAAREYFAACPAVLDVIRRGDDAREDL